MSGLFMSPAWPRQQRGSMTWEVSEVHAQGGGALHSLRPEPRRFPLDWAQLERQATHNEVLRYSCHHKTPLNRLFAWSKAEKP